MMKPSACLFLLVGPHLASAVDFYVSPCGSDENSGNSLKTPFRTLTKAQEVVQQVATDSMSEDVRIHLAPGTYHISGPWMFASADSGKNGHSVVWTRVELNRFWRSQNLRMDPRFQWGLLSCRTTRH